ncbi:transmembrane protein 254 isoform X2 [Dasypus novemcinctus]|uniref:transmembrane protein 254 isoform X2 n=1 Tax=Dasypus novemcinctus TaxID=9361 RepID=UPI00265DEB03|nr:transmembrane protein 254 isoform X3 [Dasypus novemcinctus]
MRSAKSEGAYFQKASLFWLTVITLSMGYYTWVVFWPQSIPYQRLGPLGPFTQYLVDNHPTLLRNGFWLAWLIHVGESLYAMVLCRRHQKPNLGPSVWEAGAQLLEPHPVPAHLFLLDVCSLFACLL